MREAGRAGRSGGAPRERREGARADEAARPASFYWLETRTVYDEQFGAPPVRFTRTTH